MTQPIEPRRAEQLVLDLAGRPALDAEDFLISASNAAAIALIDQWPGWAMPAAVVSGPEGAGKSHLVSVWRSRSGAATVPAAGLTDGYVARLPPNLAGLAVEDIDRGLADERALFHLLNVSRERSLPVLLTTRAAPGELRLSVPDLASRLRMLPHAAISAPDAPLLGAVLVKLFADRQLLVQPAVVAYLVSRMERSMASANRIVAEIDRRSLSDRRKVSRALAADVLAGLDAPH